jgi:hypothetical protein
MQANENLPPVKRFATADIETDPFHFGDMPKPFAAGFYLPPDPETNEPGETQIWWGEDCIQKLVARCKKFRGLIYFHNGGKFDVHFLLPYLPLSRSDSLVIGSRIVSLAFPAGYEFRDSFALIPLPLAAWGKREINIQKLKKSRREKHKAEIIEYLKDDCKFLHEMLSAFFARWPQKPTLASVTRALLETKFDHKIPHFSAGDDAKFRRYYFAGRVNFFALGCLRGPFTILDINSAFPWSMQGSHWWCRKFTSGAGKPAKKFNQSFLVVECDGGGSLPLRAADKSVFFPNGTIHRFFVSGWEVRAGVRTGSIKNLKYIWHHTPRRTESFVNYVKFFFKMKADAKARGDKAAEFHAKLFLNACYGVLGIDPTKFRDVQFTSYYDAPKGPGWSEAWHNETAGVSVYQRPAKQRSHAGYTGYNCICAAASITGRVRAFLHESMHRCKGVVYCDTDSIIARKVGRLSQGDKLGQWKNEMVCDVIWIGGKKLYVAHNADYPWEKDLPKGEKRNQWVFINGFGWNPKPTRQIKSFKTAAKGVKLSIPALVAVCSGHTRKGRFDAPSYSALAPSKFITRTIRRADKRK